MAYAVCCAGTVLLALLFVLCLFVVSIGAVLCVACVAICSVLCLSRGVFLYVAFACLCGRLWCALVVRPVMLVCGAPVVAVRLLLCVSFFVACVLFAVCCARAALFYVEVCVLLFVVFICAVLCVACVAICRVGLFVSWWLVPLR